MRPSLIRAFAAYPTSMVQRSVRGRVSTPHPSVVRHVASGTAAAAISGGRRHLSGTAGRGAGEGNFGDDIADLNAEIEGFVGDLGDPDFDTTAPSAPSGPQRDAQDAPVHLRGSNTQPGGTSAEHQAVQSISAQQPRTRLTQADHPIVTRVQELDPEPERPDWTASLIGERHHDDNDTRGARSVLVLNGAACFIAGKLASTGEPRGVITKSMEAAAAELNLSLIVCTSNREDELLDKLCEGGYDAIVYNPSGFRAAGPGVSTTTPLHPAGGMPSTAGDPDAAVQAKGGEEGALRGRQPMPADLRQQLLRDDFEKHSGNGRAIEYGLARARCPVVIVSPRDGIAPAERVPCQLGGGAISGFSGAVSYRLAMVAVASVLDDHR